MLASNHRRLLAAAGALAVLARASPTSAASRRWTLWASPSVVWLNPVGDYRPLRSGADWGAGLHATLSRAGLPLALRFDGAVLGSAATFEDTVAILGGARWPDPVDVFVGNDEAWATLGVQWDRDPAASGVYAFLTAGTMSVTGRVTASDPDFRIPDAPRLPRAVARFCVIGGAGVRGAFGAHRTHAVHAELSFLGAGAGDYVGTPAVRADLGHTTFPTRRSHATAWLAGVGYSHAFRWGGPKEPRPPKPDRARRRRLVP